VPKMAALPTWPPNAFGDDQLLEDMATMDPSMANSFWRVAHEMPEDELQWLTFSYAGKELEPGGEDLDVDASNRARYVRLCCKASLLFQAQKGLQAFSDGFFDVLPEELAKEAPADIFQWLLVGQDEISQEELNALEEIVLRDGLVPKNLSTREEVVNEAKWVFEVARESNGSFRSRLFEFWTGSSRLPLGGATSIEPKPRLQIMVQAERQAPVYVWEVQVPGGWKQLDPNLGKDLSDLREKDERGFEYQMGQTRLAIDFVNMMQINKSTGARARVRQRQVQVQAENKRPALKRIDAWPQGRLPEGHTCGNELWIPLCETKEELSRLLNTAVMNFEAGFALA